MAIARAALSATQEIRQVKREARELWLRLRREAGQTRFTDPRALGFLERAIERCYGQVEARDIFEGLRRHAADEFCQSLWYADEWSKQAKLTRDQGTFADLPIEEQISRLRGVRA